MLTFPSPRNLAAKMRRGAVKRAAQALTRRPARGARGRGRCAEATLTWAHHSQSVVVAGPGGEFLPARRATGPLRRSPKPLLQILSGFDLVVALQQGAERLCARLPVGAREGLQGSERELPATESRRALISRAPTRAAAGGNPSGAATANTRT